jgi:phosphoesterase RecJ-like protein
MLDEFGLTEDETEGFIDVVRTLKDAQIVILLKEVRPGRVKVSLRSRGGADAAAVARAFGGGGHVRAAGMTLAEPLEAARERVLQAARGALPAPP